MDQNIMSTLHSDDYRMIFDSIDEGVSILEKVDTKQNGRVNFRFILSNPASEKITGLIDVAGKTVVEVLPDVSDRMIHLFDNVLKTGQPVRFESYEKSLDKWFGVYAFPIGESEHKRVAVIFSDISAEVECSRVEEAYRESENRCRTVIETAGEGIIYASPVGACLYCNKRFADMLGYSQEELHGKLSSDFSFDCKQPPTLIRSELDKYDVLQGENRFRRKDGSELWTMFNASPVLNTNGEHVANFAMYSDITDRKRADNTLLESEKRQAFLLKLSDALRPIEDPIQVQNISVCLLGGYLAANHVFYSINDGDYFIIHKGYDNGLPPLAGKFNRMDFGERLVAEYCTGRTAVCCDVTNDPRFTDAEAKVITERGFRAYIDVPLVKGGQWIATLAVRSIEPRAWKPEEATLVEQVAERTWAAVEWAKAKAEKGIVLSQAIEEQERLRAIINSIDGEVWISDKELNISLLNPATQNEYGLKNDNKSLLEFVDSLEILEPDGSLRPREDTPLLRGLKGETASGEVIIRHLATGELRYRRHNCAPIRDRLGNITGAVGVCKDITDEKRTEWALRESTERELFILKLNEALRPLSDPIEIQGAVTRIAIDHFCSDRCYYCEIENEIATIWQDATCGDQPSVIGVYNISNFPFHKALIDAKRPFMINDVTTTDQVDEGLRQSFIRIKIISYLAVPLVKGGKLVGILCITQCSPRNWTESEAELAIEIAERTWSAVDRARTEKILREHQEQLLIIEKEKRETLEEAIKLKEEFLYLITHEFKTPITIISSVLQSIDTLMKTEVPKKLERHLNMIKLNTNRQLRLVNNLIDITRINSGNIKINAGRFDIVYITKKIIESVEVYALQKGIRLHFESKITKKELFIDEGKYEQIMLNLLSNALKFTPNGKSISVKISTRKLKKKNFISISVKDEGIGIPADRHHIIFERFGQADTSLSRQAEGTGLGLHLVKLLIDVLGWEIHLKSEIGSGSTFTILIPATQQQGLLEATSGEEQKSSIYDGESRIVQAARIEFSDIYFS